MTRVNGVRPASRKQRRWGPDGIENARNLGERYDDQVKWTVITMRHLQGRRIDDIVRTLSMPKSTVKRTLQYYREHGGVHGPRHWTSGRRATLAPAEDRSIIEAILEENCILYLDEVRPTCVYPPACRHTE